MPVRYKYRKEAHRHFIREWRVSRGLSLTQLAEASNMSVASLSRLELGHQMYTQPTLGNIAEALGCEPAELILFEPGGLDELLFKLIRQVPPSEKERVASIVKNFVPGDLSDENNAQRNQHAEDKAE